MTVTGIVLGAGASRRLGRPKQTLPLGDRTILGHALHSAEMSAVDEVVLVVGGAADAALDRLEPKRAVTSFNESYGSGCASSLLAGLDTFPDTDAILLLLGDVPLLPVTVINAMVTEMRESRPWGAVTDFRGGIIGHPFGFGSQAFSTLRELHGDKAVWKLVDDDPQGRMRRVRVDTPPPADVNTWADYLNLCRSYGFTAPQDLVPEAESKEEAG